jgi:hypothetical protein
MQQSARKIPSILAIPTVQETALVLISPNRETPQLLPGWDEDEVNSDYYFSSTND